MSSSSEEDDKYKSRSWAIKLPVAKESQGSSGLYMKSTANNNRKPSEAEKNVKDSLMQFNTGKEEMNLNF